MKTKKLKILLSVLFLFSMFFTNAQNVGIGDREFVPNTSAILDLQSSSKGVLVPRVTMAQRLYISVNPQTEGLLVYQTDQDNGFYYYDGMIWQHLQISITNSNGEVIIPGLPTLATVATTGSFNDLVDKPTIPVYLVDLEQDLNYAMYVTRAEKEGWTAKSNFSGYYNDLIEKPQFSTVATSGSYTDLQNKPTVPTNLLELQQDPNYAMYVTRAEKEGWTAKADVSQIPVSLFPVGAGQVAGNGLTQYAKGTTGGEEKHELTSQEMPSHNHQIGEGYYNNASNNSSAGKLVAYEQYSNMGNSGHLNTPMYSWDTGGDVSKNTVAHENRPPYYGIFYIIKTSDKCVKTGSTIQVIN